MNLRANKKSEICSIAIHFSLWSKQSGPRLTLLTSCSWGFPILHHWGCWAALPLLPCQQYSLGLKPLSRSAIRQVDPALLQPSLSSGQPWAAKNAGLRNADSVLPPGLENRSWWCQAWEEQLGSQLCCAPWRDQVPPIPQSHWVPCSWTCEVDGRSEVIKKDLTRASVWLSKLGMGGSCGNWSCPGPPS
jgi:hypothetical protein